MEVEIIKYPYDDTGLAQSNLAQDERHKVHESTKFVLLRGGCYYRSSLEITLLDTNEVLKEDTDFKVGNFYQEATLEVGQAVYGTIFFIRPISGTISVTVQYIGGKYSIDVTGIAALLEQIGSRGDKVLWDDIIKPDSGIKPTLHVHNTQTDMKGTQEVVDALLLIADNIFARTQAITAMSSGYSSSELETRLNNRSIHKTDDYSFDKTWFDARTVIFTGHSTPTVGTLPIGMDVRQGMYLFAASPGCTVVFEDAPNQVVYGTPVVNGVITLDPGIVYRIDGIGNNEYLISKHG